MSVINLYNWGWSGETESGWTDITKEAPNICMNRGGGAGAAKAS